MSLESETKTIIYLECDGGAPCTETYCRPGYDLSAYDEPYEEGDEHNLRADAIRDGWTPDDDKWYCEQCAIRLGHIELTPIQQAALMQGRQVVLA